mmetsp:Transcript_780/g.1168  ORF Transcript_780/g.1168 Transcript_780/m.1168 type:complete len:314 (+) Transcript_780:146-1087(+)
MKKVGVGLNIFFLIACLSFVVWFQNHTELFGVNQHSRKLIGYMRGQHVYEKQDTSSSVRLVFVSALHSSGQSQFTELWEVCENCVVEPELSNLLFKMFTEVGSIPAYFGLKTKVMEKMNSLKQKYEGQDVSIVLNTAPNTSTMPYPASLEKDDYPKHPDLNRLAHLARKASLDLRIIVIVRDAPHVMKQLQNTQRNMIFGYNAREFVDLCEIQIAQLLDIDPKYYVCWDHNDPVNEETLKKIGDHIDFKSSRGDLVAVGKKIFREDVPPGTLSSAQNSMIDFYRICVDNLRELCEDKPESLSKEYFSNGPWSR